MNMVVYIFIKSLLNLYAWTMEAQYRKYIITIFFLRKSETGVMVFKRRKVHS